MQAFFLIVTILMVFVLAAVSVEYLVERTATRVVEKLKAEDLIKKQ